MNEQLQEAIDIIAGIMNREPHWPVGLVRVHRLLGKVLDNAFLDPDDVAGLAPDIDEELVELTAEPRFPAA